MPPCAPAPVCRHLRTDGTPCGSPALRGKPVCFYHDAARQPLTVTRDLGRVLPNLPAPDDLHAIQIGYSHLLRLIATDEIAPRTATLLLRTLAQASQNLARIHRRERTHPAQPVATLILDPAFGPLAPEPAPAPAEQNQYFTDLEENPAATPPGAGAPRLASETQPDGGAGAGAPRLASETQPDGGAGAGAPRLASETQPDGGADAGAGAPRLASETQPDGGADAGAGAPRLASETQPDGGADAGAGAPRLASETWASGPLTLNEQYILADRDHRLSPAARHAAITAIATRIRNSTPEDRQRDQDILAARTQPTPHQYFTDNPENPANRQTPTLAHATAA